MPLYINTEGGNGNPQNTTLGNSYSALNISGTSFLLNNTNTNNLATQSWVTSQLNNTTLTGHSIVTYSNASCDMQCSSTQVCPINDFFST